MRTVVRHLANNTNGRTIGQWALLSVWALLLTVVLTLCANKIETIFLQNYPFFFDPMSYDLINVDLFQQIQEHGRLNVALNELLTNDRNPLRTIPIILFAPKLLAKHSGHLATAVPLLFSFLLLFAHRIWRKSKSFLLAFAVTFLFCATPAFINVTYGFGANWLDLSACFSMGAAVICLLNAFESQPDVWLSLFGIFATVTALSRYSAAFYLGFYAAPVVLWFLTRTYIQKQKKLSSLIKPVCILLVTTFPTIVFVLRYIVGNLTYYHQFGYALDGTFGRSLDGCCLALTILFHPALLFVLGVCLVIEICLLANKSKSSIQEFLIVAWLPLSVFIFLVPIVRTIGSVHPLVYFIPSFFICVFGTGAYATLTKKTITLISVLLLAFATVTAANGIRENCKIARHPDVTQQLRKQVDIAFARCISNSKAKYYAEFDFESWAPTLESFYGSGWLPASQGKSFSIHEAYLKSWYPGLTPAEVASKIYRIQCDKTQLVMVHAKTDDILKNPKIDNDYTRKVSTYLSEHVKDESQWKLISTVNSEFGELNIYRNVRLDTP